MRRTMAIKILIALLLSMGGVYMIESIYRHLETPKTIEELYDRINDMGLKWNIYQLQLLLQMDKNIIKNGNTYSIPGKDTEKRILNSIKEIMGAKPMIPIKKIMEELPGDISKTQEEVKKIALDSGDYVSPNGAILKKI